jgi:PadR family transcriptional regulator PadR
MPEISQEWIAELKKGSVQLMLLALLVKEEKYGLEITKELRELSGGYFDLKEGTLYPALRRLEQRGFVESRWVEKESGVPRKYYKLTSRGLTAFNEASEVWETMSASCRRVLEAAR